MRPVQSLTREENDGDIIWVRFISVETTVPTLAPRASAVRFEKRPKSFQSTFGTFFSQLI
jgi:hypothetical protein